MRAHMTSSTIIVSFISKVINFIGCKFVLTDCKSDKSWHMLFLCPWLDVEANVYKNSILGLGVSILNHKLACHGSCNTLIYLKHDIDFLLSKVLSHLVDCFSVFIWILFNSFLTHEGVMYFGRFACLVKSNLDVARPAIPAQAWTKKSICIDFANKELVFGFNLIVWCDHTRLHIHIMVFASYAHHKTQG